MSENKYLSLLRMLMGEIDAHDWSEVDADEVERLALLWRARYVDSYPDTQNARDARRFRIVIGSPDFVWNGRKWPELDHDQLREAIDRVGASLA